MDDCFRRLGSEEAEAAARVHRAAFDDQLPWLAGLHTPLEDAAFYRTVVFEECAVWGAFSGGELVAIMAVRKGWIDQLYVLPKAKGQGLGSALLAIAKSDQASLSLWTFQRNETACRFYERHGFLAAERTDGSTNEEREPDVRYDWRKTGHEDHALPT